MTDRTVGGCNVVITSSQLKPTAAKLIVFGMAPMVQMEHIYCAGEGENKGSTARFKSALTCVRMQVSSCTVHSPRHDPRLEAKSRVPGIFLQPKRAAQRES